MENHASEAKGPTETSYQLYSSDAQILEKAVRESISTSPEAFLKTTQDIDTRASDYWQNEISSATWAVIQRADEVVGIAVARLPEFATDWNINRDEARFIESVWIAPGLRGSGLGERLVSFLIEAECARTPLVWQFLLWVIDENSRAISLYERMGFKYADQQDLPDRSGRSELRYEYRLETDPVKLQKAAAARRSDWHKDGLTYRVLGDGETR